MAQDFIYREVRMGPGRITPVVRNLIIANVAVFVVQTILSQTALRDALVYRGGMVPALFIFKFHVWQPVTYMFLHGDLTHILFNMFSLWMFGTDVEERMGSRVFAIYYFFCGVGAGLLTCLFPRYWGVPTIGASGAIFGVLLAFGLLFPDRMILFMFIFPMRAFYFAVLMGLLQVYFLYFNFHGNVSYIAHVGGMLFGFIFFRYGRVIINAVNRVGGTAPRGTRPTRVSTEEDRRKVDAILDKINRDGIHRLTRAERNFLRDHARRNKK